MNILYAAALHIWHFSCLCAMEIKDMQALIEQNRKASEQVLKALGRQACPLFCRERVSQEGKGRAGEHRIISQVHEGVVTQEALRQAEREETSARSFGA